MGKLNARNKNNYFNELSTNVNQDRLILLNLIKINLDELNIIYRAEGNANLVLSLPDTRQVLRLRKSIIHEIDTKDTIKLSLNELQECIEYTKFVSSIIGKFLTCEPQLVQLEINNLKNFNNWLLNFRPADRLNKELRCRYGTLYPDVAFLPLRLMSLRTMSQVNNKKKTDTFCIEIKPKQGWTFYQTNGISEFKNNKCLLSDVNKCRYCCMQYLKLEKGTIHQISRYCPIDLFSGKRTRMHKAIHGLFDSPQNNLRIFKNETLIFGDKLDKNSLEKNLEGLFGIDKTHEQRMEIFINLIISILMKDVTNDNASTVNFVDDETDDMNMDQKICKTIDYTNLPIHSALRRTLDIQLLAKSGLKDILYFNDTQSTASYIDNLLKKYSKENFRDTIEFLEKLNKYEKYLLGATALDCSLMLSFQQITDLEYNSNYDVELKKYTIIENNMNFLTNVTIMDLDPKSTTHYAKYLRQTKASHMAYKNFLQLQSNKNSRC